MELSIPPLISTAGDGAQYAPVNNVDAQSLDDAQSLEDAQSLDDSKTLQASYLCDVRGQSRPRKRLSSRQDPAGNRPQL